MFIWRGCEQFAAGLKAIIDILKMLFIIISPGQTQQRSKEIKLNRQRRGYWMRENYIPTAVWQIDMIR